MLVSAAWLALCLQVPPHPSGAIRWGAGISRGESPGGSCTPPVPPDLSSGGRPPPRPPPQQPGTDSCPQAGPFPEAGSRGLFPEPAGQEPGLRLPEEAATLRGFRSLGRARRSRPAPHAGCRGAWGPSPACRPHTAVHTYLTPAPRAELTLSLLHTRSPHTGWNQGGRRGPRKPAQTTLCPVVSWRGFSVCEPAEQPLLTKLWGTCEGVGPARPPWPPRGPQRCFLVVQEPGPSVASSSFRKPNCSFIF